RRSAGQYDSMQNAATDSAWNVATDQSGSTDSVRAILHPSMAPLFWRSERTGTPSSWWAHVHFAYWLVVEAKTRVPRERGEPDGVSYAAVVEAVMRGATATRCHAVDTLHAGEHAGEYGADACEEFRRYHDMRYGSFSTLLRGSVDDAIGAIADHSIDLLHLDGLRTYEAVSRNFQRCLPKLSERAVVLLHNTNERRDDFGVWRLWEEVSRQYPCFEFLHGQGLGVLAAGGTPPGVVAALCRLSNPLDVASLRSSFAALGEGLAAETATRTSEQEARRQIDRMASAAAGARDELRRAGAEAAAHLERVRAQAQAQV